MLVNIAHSIENKELSTQCYRTDNSQAKKTTENKGILASNFCSIYLLTTTVTTHIGSIPSSLMSSILPFNTNITSLNIYCKVQNMRLKRHYYFKTQITATFKWQVILLRKH